MSLPEKLIAVGMRYQSGAEQYLKKLVTPVSVALHPESNKEATGGIAYVVTHRGSKLAYIREADLPGLKREASLGNEVGKQPNFGSFPILSDYVITEIRTNYLLLKLNKKNVEPYKQEYEAQYIASTACAIPVSAEIQKTLQNKVNKGKETMFDKIVSANKTIAVTGAYMEAGRIANNQVTKLVAAKAPLMVKGYIDTPIGKVVLANLTMMAVDQFRPTDVKLKKVASAMGAVAYQELIQTVDIEGMLNELTSSEGIKAALAAVAGQEEVLLEKA